MAPSGEMQDPRRGYVPHFFREILYVRFVSVDPFDPERQGCITLYQWASIGPLQMCWSHFEARTLVRLPTMADL